MDRLNYLLGREDAFLQDLPPYTKAFERIEGRSVRFETIREPFDGAKGIVVVRAFVRTWRRPTFLSLHGVGHLLADGFIIRLDGQRETARDEVMWDFR